MFYYWPILVLANSANKATKNNQSSLNKQIMRRNVKKDSDKSCKKIIITNKPRADFVRDLQINLRRII